MTYCHSSFQYRTENCALNWLDVIQAIIMITVFQALMAHSLSSFQKPIFIREFSNLLSLKFSMGLPSFEHATGGPSENVGTS
jgi:hypothetical protein